MNVHLRLAQRVLHHFAQRYPELRRGRIDPVFGKRSIRFLVGAYRRTYGAAPDTRHFLQSHRRAGRRAMQGAGLSAISAFTMPDGAAEDHDEPGPVRALRSFVGRRSVGLAYLLPAPPPLWLINAVRDVEETFVDLFLEEYESGAETLANVNLDTGRPDLEEQWHGGLRRSLALPAELGAPIRPTEIPDDVRAADIA